MAAVLLASVTAWLGALRSLWLLRQLSPSRLSGDEAEYAGQQRAPLWVRVPAFGLFVRGAMRLARGHRRKARLRAARRANILLSALAIWLAVFAAWQLGGPIAAALVAVFLLLSAEQALLAIHLWPEQALGGLFLAWVLLLDASGAAAAIGLGFAAGLAVLVRLDFLALTVAAALMAVLGLSGGFWPTAAGQGAGLVLATLWNLWRHGVAAPDTTMSYNLAIWQDDHARPGQTTQDLQRAAGRRLRRGAAVDGAGPAGGRFTAVAVRLAVLLGRETFLSQRMLAPAANFAGYDPRGQERVRARLGGLVSWATTLQVALFALLLPVIPAHVIGALAVMLAVSALVVTRSRYRVAFLPVLGLAVATALSDLIAGRAMVADLWPGGLALAALLVFLWRFPPRAELALEE